MRTIQGKLALVTGAASGIGQAIAIRLAEEGANLVLLDIDEPGLANVVAETRLAGVEVLGRRCDVYHAAQISETVAFILDRCEGVDILVNNAGITYHGGTAQMSAEHWDRVLRINLHSHIQFTCELLPSMLAKPEAHVLNVCSVLGLVGMPKVNAYCTTKFALVGFTESLRAEYGREGLGVTALCPGLVDTRLFASAPLQEEAKKPKIPPRLICTTPEKVAGAAIKAIYRDRRMVVTEPLAHLVVGAKRWMPGVLDLLLRLGRQKRIQRKQARTTAIPEPRKAA